MKTKSMRQGIYSSDHRTDGNRETSQLINDLKQRLELYELIFDSIHNGAIVTDAEGYVTHFNVPYGRFLGLDPAQSVLRDNLSHLPSSVNSVLFSLP